MDLPPNAYQRECLKALEKYFRRAATVGAKVAFIEQTGRPYRSVAALPGLPYVCLRVPTGGGKTLLAAHSVGVTAKEYLRCERCVVLWLAPTDAIVGQTLKALKDREHPYRKALDEAFGGSISTMTLGDALYITRAALDASTVVIVSTLAAMRVQEKEGRKVYESNGSLQAHFSGLAPVQEEKLEKSADGVTSYSLANVLRLRCPIVIMDEAHNARTPLSFETLSRINPACVIEFTATPDQDINPSNVLYTVSAAELKAEHMVKLPIRLLSYPQWKDAVDAAINKQKQLEEVARQEMAETGEYIRPIVLFQAQPRSQNQETITVESLRRSLIEDYDIPAAEIAEGTGEKWEIPDNLLTNQSKVRFVLTVAALREGWDCPWAYVLCSVSNLSSRTAVEQVLGRVLRLPRATKKNHPELNLAYAFATSARFTEAAGSLVDALVETGFEKFEAKSLVEPDPTLPLCNEPGTLFATHSAIAEPLSAELKVAQLPPELRKKVAFRPADAPGQSPLLTYSGPPLTDQEMGALRSACGSKADVQAVERLVRRSWGQPIFPAALGSELKVPVLALRQDGTLELFDEQFHEVGWNLADCDEALSDAEFSINSHGPRGATVDVDEAGKAHWRVIEEMREQGTISDVRGPRTPTDLALWLDREIPHPDIPQHQTGLFLRKAVDYLISKRGIPLVELVRARFRLRDAIALKIDSHRRFVLATSYQKMLLPGAEVPLEVSPECCFTYPLDQYPANRLYQGRVQFEKHYYECPGDMNDEEAGCAAIIDSLGSIEYWVRNLERQPTYSFWLQTSTDKFYPDFVAKLRDGRILAVEYKGEDRMSNDDTREKRALGEMWAARSKGKCVFVLVGKHDMDRIIRQAAS